MDKDIFEGAWEQIKDKIKQSWDKLTDDDLSQIEACQRKIYGRLQRHYSYSKEQAERAVQKFRMRERALF